MMFSKLFGNVKRIVMNCSECLIAVRQMHRDCWKCFFHKSQIRYIAGLELGYIWQKILTSVTDNLHNLVIFWHQEFEISLTKYYN